MAQLVANMILYQQVHWTLFSSVITFWAFTEVERLLFMTTGIIQFDFLEIIFLTFDFKFIQNDEYTWDHGLQDSQVFRTRYLRVIANWFYVVEHLHEFTQNFSFLYQVPYTFVTMASTNDAVSKPLKFEKKVRDDITITLHWSNGRCICWSTWSIPELWKCSNIFIRKNFGSL